MEAFPVPGGCEGAHFLLDEQSLPLNGLHNSDGVPSIVKMKDHHSTDMLFSVISVFVEKAFYYMEDGQQTKVDTLSTELLMEIYGL